MKLDSYLIPSQKLTQNGLKLKCEITNCKTTKRKQRETKFFDIGLGKNFLGTTSKYEQSLCMWNLPEKMMERGEHWSHGF